MDIEEGVNLFNDGKYFEAHDYFEDIWMNTVGNDKEFYQGLTQISVGTFHLASENINGALSQYSKGLEKLEKYENEHLQVNLQKLKEEINFLIEQITVFISKKSFNLGVTKFLFIELNINKT